MHVYACRGSTGSVRVRQHSSAFAQPLLQWKTSKYYTFWGRVCILRYRTCNARAPYCQMWPVRLYNIYVRYVINVTIFEEEEYKMCVLSLSPASVWNSSHYKRKWARYDDKSTQVCRSSTPLLSYFNGILIFSTDFSKYTQYKISLKSVKWEPSCFIRTDRQTDRHDEANSRFSQIRERA